jgi:hypothetical protein
LVIHSGLSYAMSWNRKAKPICHTTNYYVRRSAADAKGN